METPADVLLVVLLAAAAGFYLFLAAATDPGWDFYYPDGVSLSGATRPPWVGTTRVRRLNWTRVVFGRVNQHFDFARPCVVRVQLGDRVFGPADFADLAVLAAAGWEVTRRDDHAVATALDPGGASVAVDHDGEGRLLAVTVHAPRQGVCRVWVGETSLSLPCTRAEMRRTLGRPPGWRTAYRVTG